VIGTGNFHKPSPDKKSFGENTEKEQPLSSIYGADTMLQTSFQASFSVEPHTPVCIGDLVSHSFTISPNETMESVLREMEKRPELPGVIVLGKQISVISRLKMFERLGHQYGVELFLRKPISKLEEALKAKAFLVPAHTRIEEAVQMALSRPQPEIYDPIISADENKNLRLVDMHILLLAQSRILANVGNMVGKFEQLEKIISADITPGEMLHPILELLSHVVPYHQAAILLHRDNRMVFAAQRGTGWSGERSILSDDILNSLTYQMIQHTRQAVCLADVTTIRDWEHFSSLGGLRCWLGAPLLGSSNLGGILSLGRITHSPFNKTEKDTAQVFASRIADALEKGKKNLIWKSPMETKKIEYQSTAQVVKAQFRLSA
jgi:hypothetical protein